MEFGLGSGNVLILLKLNSIVEMKGLSRLGPVGIV